MFIVFVGVNLAKNVFAVQGINQARQPAVMRPSVPCAKLHELIAAGTWTLCLRNTNTQPAAQSFSSLAVRLKACRSRRRSKKSVP
jgi:hypothetical protein